MDTIVIDFETYYSTKKKYSLKNLSIVEYIHHPEFYAQGCSMKVNHHSAVWFSRDEVQEALDQIDWSNARVIAHNIKFDGAILAWKYGIKPAQWIDTKAMVKAILGSSIPSASLKDAAEALGLPAKGELKTNNIKELTQEQEDELAEYCKRDVDLCHDIFYALCAKVPDSQWSLIDWTVRAFLEPKLEIDGAKCLQVYNSIVERKAELLKVVGVPSTTISSNLQFAELLKNEGFSVPVKRNKDGKEIPALSIQDKEFIALSQSKNQRLKDLCEARIAVKQTLEETRAKKMADISEVSPYCFDVVFSGAQQTHRFSGSDGCAGNPQNFRRGSELREAIKVGKGQKLIVADFSNIELRVLAFLSRDPELTSAIKKQEDVYCKFASKIYGFPVTKENKKERMVGKAAVLGLGYGMGAEKFKRTVQTQTGQVLQDKFAKQVVSLYRNTYNGVPKFWQVCEQVLDQINKPNPRYFPGVPFLALERNGVKLPSGLAIRYNGLQYGWKQMYGKWRKEWVYERYKSKKQQLDKTKIYGGMVTENLCQGIAGEICKEAIVRLINYGYPPVGQVHDELLVVCDEDEVEKVKYLVAAAMTDPMPWWPQLPLEVEINSGDNWLEAK